MQCKTEEVLIRMEGVGDFRIPAGMNLRDALRREGVFLDSACGGTGTCGRCAVEVREGKAGAPSAAERAILRRQGLDEGHRLACQVFPRRDLVVGVRSDRLLELDRSGRWKETWDSPLWRPDRFPVDGRGRGVALDLGTSAVAAALFDLASARPLDLLSRPNPQARWGADILSRLQAADTDPAAAREMARSVRELLGRMVRELSSRNGLSPGGIGQVMVVGNTAMHHLALGLPVRSLLVPPFAPMSREASPMAAADLGLSSSTRILFLPPLGGYVGSDALVSFLAARDAVPAGALLDLGTNCEIVLWEGDKALAASAPAGPAFEGGHISRGMRAEEGAIFRVRLTDLGVTTEVIGGGAARGVCGTGIVDAASELVRLGLLDRRGLMVPGSHPAVAPAGLVLDAATGVVFIPADLAELQKAKAAVAATLRILFRRLSSPRPAASTPGGRMTFYLSGAFGSRLDPEAAIRIGLLPGLSRDRFLPAGNTALLGAAYCLLSGKARREAERLPGAVTHVSVAEDPAFENLYLHHLLLAGEGRHDLEEVLP